KTLGLGCSATDCGIAVSAIYYIYKVKPSIVSITKPINHATKKRQLKFLFFSLISFGLLLYMFFTFPPTQQLYLPSNISFSVIPVFFILLFLFFFSFITFILNNYIHGILAGLF